ncbi:MAG: imidazole glycerol phosphate synthase subunit HisH, partial [Candidatus Omnitrophica bacterium]|nr:imidazole glycerol phosphate synthase subunit HisH [Candidatus Omnitrophota bacterium]
GNLRSVYNAFRYIGQDAAICRSPEELDGADRLVFPGVGNAGDVINGLRSSGLDKAILRAIGEGVPFLGICVGLQMLFSSTEEAEGAECMGLVGGRVRRFPRQKALKVPQIGWNTVSVRNRDCPLFKGIKDDPYFYFVHSYYCESEEPDTTAGVTEYGVKYTSALWKDNIFAVQFHPERSQDNGLKMLGNFAEI